MLKSIGLWLLKMLLGGIFKNIQNKEAEKARAERDRAVVAAGTSDEAKDVEVGILKGHMEVEKTFQEKKPADDDPFNFNAFNKGEL